MTTQPRIEERVYWVCPTNYVWVGLERSGGTFEFGYPANHHAPGSIRFETRDAALRALEEYVARVVEGGEEHVLRLLAGGRGNSPPYSMTRAVERGEVEGVPQHAKLSFEYRIAPGTEITTERVVAGVKVVAFTELRVLAEWKRTGTITDVDGNKYTRQAEHERALTEFDHNDPRDMGWTLEPMRVTSRIEWWA